MSRQEPNRWSPRVTVATVVEKDEKLLFVREQPEGKLVLNQPAGHLEADESLIEAAIRETLEETGWEVEITGFLGVYRYDAPNGITYLRHVFIANPLRHHRERKLDQGILDACWLSQEEISANQDKMRSPLVMQAVEHYLMGLSYPVSLFYDQNRA